MKRTNKPITPNEVLTQKITEIPSQVVEAFNYLIKKNYKISSCSAVVKQPEVIKEIQVNFAAFERKPSSQEIIDNSWLDIETLYRDAGWNVRYEKPDWGETGESYFVFTKLSKTQ